MTRTNAEKKRDRDAGYAERQIVLTARAKWIAEHPDVADRPIPRRPWDKPHEADRRAPWWGVTRMGPHGNASHRSMFRHPSRDSAGQEAQFLAETFPGAVFVVLEAVSVHVVGEPEVRLGMRPEDANG